jgi:hypothetical protein
VSRAQSRCMRTARARCLLDEVGGGGALHNLRGNEDQNSVACGLPSARWNAQTRRSGPCTRSQAPEEARRPGGREKGEREASKKRISPATRPERLRLRVELLAERHDVQSSLRRKAERGARCCTELPASADRECCQSHLAERWADWRRRLGLPRVDDLHELT